MSNNDVIVYKVCMTDRHCYYSTCAEEDAKRYYDIGKVTKPIRGTCLYAFSDLSSAITYAMGYTVIFKCKGQKAKNQYAPASIPSGYGTEGERSVRAFKRARSAKELEAQALFENIVMMNNLTPLELVWKSKWL